MKPNNYILNQQYPKKSWSYDVTFENFDVSIVLKILIAKEKILNFYLGENCHEPLLRSLFVGANNMDCEP